MKQQEVFKKIGGIITELNEQYEYLKTIEGSLNELELELFLANSNFLTDHVLILSKLNAQNVAAASPVVPDPVIIAPATVVTEPKNDAPEPHQNYFEPLVSVASLEIKSKPEENPVDADKDDSAVPSIDLATGTDDDPYSFIGQSEPETIRHELVLDELDLEDEDEPYTTNAINDEAEEKEIPFVPASPIIKSEPKPILEPVPVAEPKAALEPEQPKVEEPEPVVVKPVVEPEKEQAKPEVLTINERISAQMVAKQGVAEQLNVQSISDLKQAINLNDKLLFVKDLFNGYSLAYSEAIEILNRFTSFTEAEQFLKNNYVTKNHWDTKPETSEKFYALLKRRYA
ncbi:hypothetical protein [Mucilaginibacter sp. L196]|uniref:hypothetical protein n=1 Tax=Mucilaginibacter sp. L196 TaxID=1641870 RepID=UPI00131B2F81|nr:hypothetical protein [Mucilaginibacter sp. L196]